MNRHSLIPVIAAGLFLCGLILMFSLTPAVRQTPTEPVSTTEYIEQTTALDTEPTTEEPTEPPTEPPTEAPDTQLPEDRSVTATHGFVYDCSADRLLLALGDTEEALAPASLTKLLTAYVALLYLPEDQLITVGNEINTIDPESSVAGLQVGHKLTVGMLVQGLIMQSGNDAAYTLAAAAGRQIAGDSSLSWEMAVGVFVDEMNAQARKLGMSNTHFMNPDGIDADGHYTSVSDLITISLAVMENETIMAYAGMATSYVIFESGQDYVWKNSNYLLHDDLSFYCPDAIGLKTGSTAAAGKCLIALFKQKDGSMLLAGVLGSDSDGERYTDIMTLYELYK